LVSDGASAIVFLPFQVARSYFLSKFTSPLLSIYPEEYRLKMDLDSYIARYSGETRLQRLLVVARTTSDEALAEQAFRMAEEQMKVDGNVIKYKEVFGGQRQQGQSAAEEGTQEAGKKQPRIFQLKR
jgi:lipopolysaccharide export system protein LptC